jgi:type III pantothenate kinase
MILCLDVGNTQIYGGVYEEGEILFHFRKISARNTSSDEIGTFLRAVIRENGRDPQKIDQVAICSVVPDGNHSLANASRHYFNVEPFFLKPGVKTGLKIRYTNPLEVGADRIANAISGISHFPGKNMIIIDFGTATTFDVVSKDKEYLGGAIVPGIRLAMETLEKNTAKLPKVEILIPDRACGRSTVESIQSGLYWSQVGLIRELSSQITLEHFSDDPPLIIGTGGFSALFRESSLFDDIIPNLVLDGVYQAFQMNQTRRDI